MPKRTPEGGMSGAAFEAPIEEKPKKPVEVTSGKVNVLGVEMPRNKERGPRVPNPDHFKTFSEDKFSLDLLQRIAKSAALDQPFLLEGEAAVGKSHAIEYLANRCNQEVYRMSLNGQTDVTDLIGKWVPRTDTLRKRLDHLLANPQKCKSPEIRKLIEERVMIKKVSKEREEIAPEKEKPLIGLTREEMETIALREGIEVPEGEWVWQDGDIPKQMTNGAWSVLDEVNTCEPQILVRLNALLERGGQLVLHEDGSRIVPRHKNFRLFATVNPPGGRYKGRVPLSAEWISRWNYQNIGDLPEEAEKTRFGLLLGLPEEEIPVKELAFIRPEAVPEGKSFADLYGKAWTKDLRDKFVTFTRQAREMARKDEVGKDHAQKFDYDQRDNVRFFEYLSKLREPGNMKKTIEEAIEYYFLNKLKDPKDRKKLKDVALGLIKVSEPKELLPKGEEEMTKKLRTVKAELAGMGIKFT